MLISITSVAAQDTDRFLRAVHPAQRGGPADHRRRHVAVFFVVAAVADHWRRRGRRVLGRRGAGGGGVFGAGPVEEDVAGLLGVVRKGTE
jgi:hypothetical protein